MKITLSIHSKCDHCQKLFPSEQGLKNHQSRDNAGNYGCHRLQITKRRENERKEKIERNEIIKNTCLRRFHADVSCGPHQKGLPLEAKEKRCIVNLYQSYLDDGLPNKVARFETARRLQFSVESVSRAIKEILSTGTLESNQMPKLMANAYEKLSEEEESDLRKLVCHYAFFKKCSLIGKFPKMEKLRTR